MHHKKHQTMFWFAFTFTLIGVLLLAWPPLLAGAGPGLPPRKPPPTAQPSGDEDDRPVGAHIELHLQGAPAATWTVVQWQDNAGSWHDVEGWQGTLDEGHQKTWWVDQRDFGRGPFRWVVYGGPDGRPLATSAPFDLPRGPQQNVQVEVLHAP